MNNKLVKALVAASVLWVGQAVAVPVDLELIIATDVSGSVDGVDFALRRSGIEAAFRDADVIAAIEAGAIGSIAVTLWDYSNNVGVGVDWFLISDAASSNAFADAVAATARQNLGSNDGLSNLMNQALTSLNGNDFDGRSVLDIVSEGSQDVDGCTSFTLSCLSVQNARDAFLAGGGDAINALWLQDRTFFGLNPGDSINAFEYGTINVIGGAGSFQAFAANNADFVEAFRQKILREVRPPVDVPEPGTLLLLSIGLMGAGFARRVRK